MTIEADSPDFTTLQSLIRPEQGVCTERELYVRLNSAAARSESRREIRFAASGEARFDTWFNMFNLAKWREQCGLGSLYLALSGKGEFELSVFLAPPDHSWERVLNEIVTLTGDGPLRLDLGAVFEAEQEGGVLFFELRALKAGRLTDMAWQTTAAPRRQPKLALAITTFRREAEVARTVARFNAFLDRSWMKDHVQLIVVDNGQSAAVDQTDHVSLVPNENLGGAGGFTRGLLEATDRGATHCLFMDDDASIHMESLERTWMFLAYAIDPATAISGAMINAQHRWAIWENGALFHSRCQPLHMGTDLRDIFGVLNMEFTANRPVPDNFYGGWWYFAFPLDRVRHMAFPFFVRGDDVSFSLVHDFNIVTLNGVVSFQESFTEKESPQTWYLDLRSHMAHHLSLPALEAGRFGVLKIAAWFFLRNLPRMHYETLSAINLAVEDVMEGPDFFDRNADMAQRRADIKALTEVETWKPVPPEMAFDDMRHWPPGWRTRLFYKLSLNGHLLPFFTRFGKTITIAADNRGHVGFVWGAAEITYLSADRKKYYTVRHSKAQMAREGWRFTRNAVRFLRDYDRLLTDYRDGYDRLTSEAHWRKKLGMQS